MRYWIVVRTSRRVRRAIGCKLTAERVPVGPLCLPVPIFLFSIIRVRLPGDARYVRILRFRNARRVTKIALKRGGEIEIYRGTPVINYI